MALDRRYIKARVSKYGIGGGPPDYEKGDVIEHGRQDRHVLVERRVPNIKRDEDGFDGYVVTRTLGGDSWRIVEEYDEPKTVWGYDMEIDRVLDRHPEIKNPELMNQ